MNEEVEDCYVGITNKPLKLDPIYETDIQLILYSKKDYEEVKRYYGNLPINEVSTFEGIKEGKHGTKRYKTKNNR